MDSKVNLYVGIILIVILILVLSMIGATQSNIYNNTTSIQNDLNILKSNDTAFASYIVQNSQTLEYLNKNCKVTSDTNEVTVLTCIKGVQ